MLFFQLKRRLYGKYIYMDVVAQSTYLARDNYSCILPFFTYSKIHREKSSGPVDKSQTL